MEVAALAPKATFEVARKDLRAELRSGDTLALELLVVALILLLFRAAAEGTPVPVGTALWVTLIFATSAGLARTFHAEADHGTLDLLIASPASPAALYLGKTLTAFILALVAGLAALLLAAAFFGAEFLREPLPLLALLSIGALGLAAQASLLSALSARSSTRAALFPLLMIPLATPLILWAARATVALSLGAPLADPAVWLNLSLAAAYDALFLPLNAALARFAL